MTMNSRWELVLALAGSAAVGAVFALSRRSERRHVEKRQHKHDLQAWEEEGGSLATPATARHRS